MTLEQERKVPVAQAIQWQAGGGGPSRDENVSFGVEPVEGVRLRRGCSCQQAPIRSIFRQWTPERLNFLSDYPARADGDHNAEARSDGDQVGRVAAQ
jgi:hypothetical protein